MKLMSVTKDDLTITVTTHNGGFAVALLVDGFIIERVWYLNYNDAREMVLDYVAA